MRAAVAYGAVSRVIALKLKYGRKVALARTMARFMAPLRGRRRGRDPGAGAAASAAACGGAGSTSRGWSRGIWARRWGLPVDQHLLRRTRPTPPLKGMNEAQRRRAVGGAFAVVDGRRIDGRTVILIDDVLTTRQHRRGLRQGAAQGGGGTSRADQLGKGGSPEPPHALRAPDEARENIRGDG